MPTGAPFRRDQQSSVNSGNGGGMSREEEASRFTFTLHTQDQEIHAGLREARAFLSGQDL